MLEHVEKSVCSAIVWSGRMLGVRHGAVEFSCSDNRSFPKVFIINLVQKVTRYFGVSYLIHRSMRY